MKASVLATLSSIATATSSTPENLKQVPNKLALLEKLEEAHLYKPTEPFTLTFSYEKSAIFAYGICPFIEEEKFQLFQRNRKESKVLEESRFQVKIQSSEKDITNDESDLIFSSIKELCDSVNSQRYYKEERPFEITTFLGGKLIETSNKNPDFDKFKNDIVTT